MTFDKVPHQSDFTGLDYDATTQEPARGVVVEAVDSGNQVLDTDVTDASGGYSVSVAASISVQIRVRSQMEQSTGATWDIEVVDNTNSNAIYLLTGSLTDSGTADSTRNLNAGSGWGGSGYTSTRAAAPFAILDGIYDAVTEIAAVDADVVFPDLQIFWSVNNVPMDGDVSQGEIGTSSYTRTNGVPTIRILGDENNDTDEYDTHVVVHEFGHYFEDQLARSDSPGGSHSLTNRLDSRLAFGEGWGNAFSAMVLDDPIYRDSGRVRQASGLVLFSVEDDLTNVPSTSINNEGWFNEASIQQILYDIYDSADDGADTISAGFAPIYAAFTDPSYVDNVDFTTMFTFANRVRNEVSVNTGVLDAMLTAEDINGSGARGIGETNTGGIASILPLYKTVTQGGGATTVCSTSTNGDTNKHGVREFISVTVNNSGSVTMTATEVSGPMGTTDPDFYIWETGRLFTRDIFGQNRLAESTVDGSETWTGTLNAGTYAIELFDANHVESTSSGDSCFSFSVS
ncbi:MAG: hypothetical protein AAFY82_07165 [Pseudomonadota bacterium]